jgi:hypothetical protein
MATVDVGKVASALNLTDAAMTRRGDPWLW